MIRMIETEFKITESALAPNTILGYKYIYYPGHPLANKAGIVYYHRYVLSVKVGHWLTRSENVHHLDGNRSNNLPDNLMLCTKADHIVHHTYERLGMLAIANVSLTKKCLSCGKEFKGRKTSQKCLARKYCSHACSHFATRRVSERNLDLIRKEIAESNWEKVARKYGVTSNTLRKWLGVGVEKKEINKEDRDISFNFYADIVY